jgi:hypothetical protein
MCRIPESVRWNEAPSPEGACAVDTLALYMTYARMASVTNSNEHLGPLKMPVSGVLMQPWAKGA